MKNMLIGFLLASILFVCIAAVRIQDSAKLDKIKALKTEQLAILKWALNPDTVDDVFGTLNVDQRKLLKVQTKVLQVLAEDYVNLE